MESKEFNNIPQSLPYTFFDGLSLVFDHSITNEKIILFAKQTFNHQLYWHDKINYPAEEIDTTICLYTTFAINKIFLNKQDHKLLKKLILNDWNYTFSFFGIALSVRNIFFNQVFVQEFPRLKEPSEGVEIIYDKTYALWEYFLSTTPLQRLYNLDINREVFKGLKNKIKLNHQPGSFNSGIYNIFIQHSHEPSVHNLFLHAFSIEQKNDQQGHYQVWNSWVQTYELERDYQERGSYTYQEMKNFLHHFKGLVCRSKKMPDYLKNKSFKNCFRIEINGYVPFMKFSMQEGRVDGITLFWTYHKVSASRSLANLSDLLKSSKTLQQRFCEVFEKKFIQH